MAAAGLGWSTPAKADANPTSAIIQVKCGIMGATDPDDQFKCHDIDLDGNDKTGRYLDGRVEFLSAGVVVANEINPRVASKRDDDEGSIDFVVTGNNDPKIFNAWYMDPLASILNAPDITVKVYVNKGDAKNPSEKLVLFQNYAPQGSALWAVHSGDTAGLQAALAAEAAARKAADQALSNALSAETARAQAAESQLQSNLNAETARAVASENAEAAARIAADNAEAAARMAADNALANQIAAEAAARAAADAALSNNLAAETAARIASDNALSNQLNAESAARQAGDQALANQLAAETAARQSGDAQTFIAAQNYANANFVHRTGNINETVSGVKEFAQNIVADTGLCYGGDCRTSFNNQDANSVTPLPRNCPSGQVPTSTGAFTWKCAPGTDANSVGSICGNANAGPTCGGAEDVGQIGWGGALTRSGSLPAGGSSEHWYVTSWANSGTAYHPHVYLSSGGAYYEVDVYIDCNGSTLSCGSEAGTVSKGDTNWETSNGGDRPLWPTPSPGQATYIRVRPLSGNATCQSYTLTIQNG